MDTYMNARQKKRKVFGCKSVLCQTAHKYDQVLVVFLLAGRAGEGVVDTYMNARQKKRKVFGCK